MEIFLTDTKLLLMFYFIIFRCWLLHWRASLTSEEKPQQITYFWAYLQVNLSLRFLQLITLTFKKECKMIKILFLPIAAEGVSLGCCAVLYEPESVLIAVGICTGATLALTFFAFQTKWDFTNCGVFLLILLVILFISGIIMICIRDK